MPRLHKWAQQIAVVVLFNYLKVVFLCVPVTKGAQMDQLNLPRTLRSGVFTYDIDAIHPIFYEKILTSYRLYVLNQLTLLFLMRFNL